MEKLWHQRYQCFLAIKRSLDIISKNDANTLSMKRRIVFGSEEMEKLWHKRDSKTFSQNDEMTCHQRIQIRLLSKNSIVSLSQRSQQISPECSKSLPNKIIGVFSHQNWSVLIYLS